MKKQYHEIHRDHSHGSLDEVLPDIPELPDHESLGNVELHAGNNPQQLSSENVARWIEQGEDQNPGLEPKSRPKSRRKALSGQDHVKHRRTRSGCFTCRSRRVKCDEARPTCERCKKGSRECTWPPEPSAKAASSRKGSKQAEPEINSSGDEDDIEIDDDDDDNATKDMKATSSASSSTTKHLSPVSTSSTKQHILLGIKRAGSATDQIKDKSMSPSGTEETRADSDLLSLTGYHSTVSTNTSHDDILWAQLKDDHQFYLNYHRESLNYCHYFLKQDLYNFIGTTLIDAALTYEPLLHAVVGFSAFRHAMSVPDQQISTFLEYYNKAVVLLRQSISSGEQYTAAMIYTILQLATFEEYMGDWANLMIHQRAACQIIKAIYTPESIVQTTTTRTLFSWYIRFDIFVSYMTNSLSFIGYEWFEACHKKTKMLEELHPDNDQYMLEAIVAEQRILGVEMSALFAKPIKGEITIADFSLQNHMLLQRLGEWTSRVRSLKVTRSRHLVWKFPNKRPVTEDDIVDPFEPGLIFDSTWFTMNYLLMESMVVESMHKLQTATILQQPVPAEVTKSSLLQCQIFEAMLEYEEAPNGAFLPTQAAIGMICLFIPRDDKHISWCRRMLTKFENNGYIYPPSLRAKIAESWSMPSISESWLPPDVAQPRIIQELRSFVAERTMKPQTQLSADVRSLKAIFEMLHVDERTVQSKS